MYGNARISGAKRSGFTLIELLIVIVVICVLAGIALPNLIASREAANEASAIGSLRVIGKAMETYHSRSAGGQHDYPDDFRDLGKLIPPELDSVLATGRKSGYAFAGGRVGDDFAITATPVRYQLTGCRSFYMDDSEVIRAADKDGAAATAGDPPIQ